MVHNAVAQKVMDQPQYFYIKPLVYKLAPVANVLTGPIQVAGCYLKPHVAEGLVT